MLYQTKNPHGGDNFSEEISLDFSASINPLGTPPAVMDAMRQALSRADHYPDPACKRLIKSISSCEHAATEYILYP